MDYVKVYPYSADIARQNGEFDHYQENHELNIACAKAIYKAVNDSNYKPDYYDFATAAKAVVDEYGFERVNWVLAHTIQQSHNDGRYSDANKAWARCFDIPEQKYSQFTVRTHPYVLDGLINKVRERYTELLTEAIGQYEKSYRIAERNRLTWFHNDFGAFVANPGVSFERLMVRYNEIMEKKKTRKKSGV